MSTKQNKQIANQLFTAFNSGNIDALDQLVAPGCIDHTAQPGESHGLEGIKQTWAQLRYAFPRHKLTVHDVIIDPDRIALQATFQVADSAGGQPEATLLEDFRVADGQIVELWNLVRWH